MIDRTEPLEPSRELRLHRLDALWLSGQIGDATYLRSLFIDGLLPDEANSRLACLRMAQIERAPKPWSQRR